MEAPEKRQWKSERQLCALCIVGKGEDSVEQAAGTHTIDGCIPPKNLLISKDEKMSYWTSSGLINDVTFYPLFVDTITLTRHETCAREKVDTENMLSSFFKKIFFF